MAIHADLLYSHTEYVVTIYFRLATKFEIKRPKMPPPMALGRILVAQRFAWPNQLVGFLLLVFSLFHDIAMFAQIGLSLFNLIFFTRSVSLKEGEGRHPWSLYIFMCYIARK